jgi:CHAT domain-containing protein
LANSSTPEQSRLLFAPSVDSTGELTAQQIEHLSIARPSLVILAACRTADGRAWALEGVTSLAQSFLVAGIPAVIATLWDVPDDGARAFLKVFFADYTRRGDAPASLARARAEIIRQRTYGPEVWAAFQLIGATVPTNRREGS